MSHDDVDDNSTINASTKLSSFDMATVCVCVQKREKEKIFKNL